MDKLNISSKQTELDQVNSDQDMLAIKFIRHSKSYYKHYQAILNSENPNRLFDAATQVMPDLSDDGLELAQDEAKKLFSGMDKDQEALFFVSSNEARALSTGKLYKDIAKEQDFAVITPDNHRNRMDEEHVDTDIRVVTSLSIKSSSLLWNAVYTPEKYLAEINWEGFDYEVKQNWDAAREVVMHECKGSWGANFSFYSDLLKSDKLLPADQNTAGDLFETQFHQILRLVRFAAKKVAGSFQGKRIRIIAFGHENYVAKAFEKYFHEEGIGNCEAIDVNMMGDELSFIRRNVRAVVENNS